MLVPQLLVMEWHLMHNSYKSKQIIIMTKKRQVPRLVPRLPFSSRCTFRSTARSRSSSRCTCRFLNAARGTFRRNIWGTFREYSWNVQGIFVDRSEEERETTLGWVVNDGRRLAERQEELIPRG